MKFNSQICTTREQSEKLLALGLKKETADMCIYRNVEFTFPCPDDEFIPAWSLHRLLSMLPIIIDCKKDLQSYSSTLYLDLYINNIAYTYTDYDYDDRVYVGWDNGLYNAVVNCIEWLIKEGYFNKEYLV